MYIYFFLISGHECTLCVQRSNIGVLIFVVDFICRVFKSLEECADRRSKMNIGGALDIAGNCVAVCCSMLRRVAVSCEYRWCIGYRWYLFCSVLQRVAACCSVLQRVAVCCSIVRILAARCTLPTQLCCSVLQRVAVCCSVLQRVAAEYRQ